MKPWVRSRGVSRAAIYAVVLGMCLSGTPRAMAQTGGSDAPAPSDRAADKPVDKPADQSPANTAAKDGTQANSTNASTTKLRILVTGNTEKPIANASVYVRYNASGGFLHHDKLIEMDLKTNQDGSVKVPAIPRGKVMIQVIAPGWHTYGKWYDADKSEQVISIKLEQPPHWY